MKGRSGFITLERKKEGVALSSFPEKWCYGDNWEPLKAEGGSRVTRRRGQMKTPDGTWGGGVRDIRL